MTIGSVRTGKGRMMMVDTEKVMQALENCEEGGSCDDCPYDTNTSRCILRLHEDALALLEEQQERIETLESLRRIEQEGR